MSLPGLIDTFACGCSIGSLRRIAEKVRNMKSLDTDREIADALTLAKTAAGQSMFDDLGQDGKLLAASTV